MDRTKAMGRILIVEDDVPVGNALRTILEFNDHLVIVAPTPDAAQQALRTSSVDVVALDLELREVDGLAILQSIRRSAPDLPVIVLSGVLSRDGVTVGDDASGMALKLGAV